MRALRHVETSLDVPRGDGFRGRQAGADAGAKCFGLFEIHRVYLTLNGSAEAAEIVFPEERPRGRDRPGRGATRHVLSRKAARAEL
jgi:hypothetical protein